MLLRSVVPIRVIGSCLQSGLDVRPRWQPFVVTAQQTIALRQTLSFHNASRDSTTAPKHCTHCGRVISQNHIHFAERKTCSKLCARTRLTSIDRQLEDLFVELATTAKSASCSAVAERWIIKFGETYSDKREDAGKWRERVRRAGRRVVAFRCTQEYNFAGVQGRRQTDLSFATGDWAVVAVKRTTS